MEPRKIHDALRTRYATVAEQPVGQFKYPVGQDSAEELKYPSDIIELIPSSVVDRFVGVGNPFWLAELRSGWHIVDIGCGAGFDAQVAAHHIGPTGRVIAVDMSPEMLAVAESGYAESSLQNIKFAQGYAESLPVEAGCVVHHSYFKIWFALAIGAVPISTGRNRPPAPCQSSTRTAICAG